MRPGKFYNQLTGKIASLSLLLCGLAYSGTAQVTVTPASNGTDICSGIALNGSLPTYTGLTMTITEGSVNDFQIGVGNSFILQAPTGWQFNPAGAPVVAVTGTDFAGTPTATVSPDGSQLTITYDVATDIALDEMQLSNVEVIAQTTTSGAGNITAFDPLMPPIAGIAGGTTNFGSVSLKNDFSSFVLDLPTVCTGVTTADITIVTPTTPPAGDYTITWDATATADGFMPVMPTPITSIIPVTVPTATAIPGTTYNGNVMFSDGCSEITLPISVTILATPTVDPTADFAGCNGEPFAGLAFTGTNATAFDFAIYSTSFVPTGGTGTGGFPPSTFTNLTPNPDSFYTIVTPMNGTCAGTTDTFLVVQNPTPRLDVALGATACAGQPFTFTNSSLTAGTAYSWERVTTDTDNPTAVSGTGNITETLNNTIGVQTFITYNDTLTANGCSFVESVIVTVNPMPVFNGTITPTPASTCSGDLITVNQSSTVPGTVFTWSRAADAHNAAATGAGDINENLVNLGVTPLNTTYVDTMNVNGCLYTHSIAVTVNPIPAITSPTTAVTCDSANFLYTPTSTLDPLTTFAWARPGASGTGNISDYLDNTTGLVEIVTYTITMTAGSCTSTAMLDVSVNPMPALTSASTASTCSGAVFTYTATASLPGTTFSWTRPAVTGITPGTGAGTTANISETLVNTTSSAKVVNYIYTLTFAGGCANTDTVTVTVNPIPALTSTKNPTPICDSTLFTYTPTGTAGATFNWYRRYVPGVVSLSVTGTGPISEYLDNSTYVPVPVAYIFTVTVGSCTAVDSMHVTVNPTPILSTHKTDSACSGIPYTYSPLAGSSLVTFAWSRASVGGITPTTASGTGNISETLNNSNTSATTVVYTYTLSIAAGSAACTNTQKLNVKVNPFIGAPSITLKSESSLCAGSAYQNFGTTSGQPAGIKYAWSAKNANVMATGSDKQYALVSFPNAGTAVVYINTSSTATGCIGRDSATVTVSGSTAQNPGVIYTGGQLIALQNDVDTYQWGYDEKATLKPNDIAGEINQNYFISSLDNMKYYWVKTTKSGCTQKSYLVKPTGVEDIATEIGLKLFPNPASQFVTVEVNTTDYNNIRLEVFNILGQQIRAGVEAGASNNINVATLPAGVYIVDCVQNGVKVASARFIKN